MVTFCGVFDITVHRNSSEFLPPPLFSLSSHIHSTTKSPFPLHLTHNPPTDCPTVLSVYPWCSCGLPVILTNPSLLSSCFSIPVGIVVMAVYIPGKDDGFNVPVPIACSPLTKLSAFPPPTHGLSQVYVVIIQYHAMWVSVSHATGCRRVFQNFSVSENCWIILIPRVFVEIQSPFSWLILLLLVQRRTEKLSE